MENVYLPGVYIFSWKCIRSPNLNYLTKKKSGRRNDANPALKVWKPKIEGVGIDDLRGPHPPPGGSPGGPGGSTPPPGGVTGKPYTSNTPISGRFGGIHKLKDRKA